MSHVKTVDRLVEALMRYGAAAAAERRADALLGGARARARAVVEGGRAHADVFAAGLELASLRARRAAAAIRPVRAGLANAGFNVDAYAGRDAASPSTCSNSASHLGVTASTE